jgi:hypothetical protein
MRYCLEVEFIELFCFFVIIMVSVSSSVVALIRVVSVYLDCISYYKLNKLSLLILCWHCVRKR